MVWPTSVYICFPISVLQLIWIKKCILNWQRHWIECYEAKFVNVYLLIYRQHQSLLRRWRCSDVMHVHSGVLMVSCRSAMCTHRLTTAPRSCISSCQVDADWTDNLKGHVSISAWQIPSFVFFNELTITLPLIFTQSYWTVFKLAWLDVPRAHRWINTHSHFTQCLLSNTEPRSHTCLIRWSKALPLVATSCRWTGQLLSVQMMMTLSDHLFVVESMWPQIYYVVTLWLHFW